MNERKKCVSFSHGFEGGIKHPWSWSIVCWLCVFVFDALCWWCVRFVCAKTLMAWGSKLKFNDKKRSRRDCTLRRTQIKQFSYTFYVIEWKIDYAKNTVCLFVLLSFFSFRFVSECLFTLDSASTFAIDYAQGKWFSHIMLCACCRDHTETLVIYILILLSFDAPAESIFIEFFNSRWETNAINKVHAINVNGIALYGYHPCNTLALLALLFTIIIAVVVVAAIVVIKIAIFIYLVRLFFCFIVCSFHFHSSSIAHFKAAMRVFRDRKISFQHCWEVSLN